MYPYAGADRLPPNINMGSSWSLIFAMAIPVGGDRLGARGRYPDVAQNVEREQKPPVGSRRATVKPGLGQDTNLLRNSCSQSAIPSTVLSRQSLPHA